MAYTLNLKKVYAGRYELIYKGVRIVVSNAYIEVGKDCSNSWELFIEVNDWPEIQEHFQTKREACKYGKNWIIDNILK